MYHQPTIDRCVAILDEYAREWKQATGELAMPMAMAKAAADMRRLTNPLACAVIDFPDLSHERPDPSRGEGQFDGET